MLTFWRWFFWGGVRKPGYRNFFDAWLFFQFSIAVLISMWIGDTRQIAANILMPLFGIAFGISFAWASVLSNVVMSKDFDAVLENSNLTTEEYVYSFQLVTLTIIVAIGFAACASIFDLDKILSISNCCYSIGGLETLFYLAVLVSVRSCWKMSLAAQMAVILHRKARVYSSGKRRFK